MCIGIPMQIVTHHGSRATCEDADGQRFDIDMMLLGELPTGTWVLTFLDTAREVLSGQQALEIQQALLALQGALRGESIDHLFADLIDREPQLPEFLRIQASELQHEAGPSQDEPQLQTQPGEH